MPLQTVPPITLTDIQGEFGGPTPIALTNYYRGGAYVPDTPVNAGVPTSGNIGLLDFLGTASVVYQAIGGAIYSTDLQGFLPDGTLFYDSDGGVRRRQESAGSSSVTSLGDWSSAHPNETGGAGWSVRVTFQSGTNTYASGSGLATWLNLGTNRSWLFDGSTSGPNTQTGTYLVEISNNGGASVFDSASLTVTMENLGV